MLRPPSSSRTGVCACEGFLLHGRLTFVVALPWEASGQPREVWLPVVWHPRPVKSLRPSQGGVAVPGRYKRHVGDLAHPECVWLTVG